MQGPVNTAGNGMLPTPGLVNLRQSIVQYATTCCLLQFDQLTNFGSFDRKFPQCTSELLVLFLNCYRFKGFINPWWITPNLNNHELFSSMFSIEWCTDGLSEPRATMIIVFDQLFITSHNSFFRKTSMTTLFLSIRQLLRNQFIQPIYLPIWNSWINIWKHWISMPFHVDLVADMVLPRFSSDHYPLWTLVFRVAHKGDSKSHFKFIIIDLVMDHSIKKAL